MQPANASKGAFTIRTTLVPGDLGSLVRLHGVVYAQEYGFAPTFEAYVAGPLADTAARVLQETLPQGDKPVQVFTLENDIRSVHGVSYTRLHNTDLVALMSEFVTDFEPPPLASSGGTGLYAGEQDMFQSCSARCLLCPRWAHQDAKRAVYQEHSRSRQWERELRIGCQRAA